jgi:hypothetical protein
MPLHIKLNELIASNKLASNRTISFDDLDAADLEVPRAFYARLAELARNEQGLKCSHLLDDAGNVHAWKSGKETKSAAAAQLGGTRAAVSSTEPGEIVEIRVVSTQRISVRRDHLRWSRPTKASCCHRYTRSKKEGVGR